MLGRKNQGSDTIRDKARERLKRLSDADILNWADVAGSGIAKALDDYRRLNDKGSLEEAHRGASQLQGALDVLRERS